ncbi:MAG: DUF2236 domain-containing protein [Myxococcales bacterium]|nr:DUF2236 domain-containing protein [Myxococcales bacterium]
MRGRYHANDADALRWVHATLADTTIVIRERLDGPLPVALKDGYMVELNRFAALFGIPAQLLPDSWAAHARYMEQMLASDRLVVTPKARELGQFLFGRGPARTSLHSAGSARRSPVALLLRTSRAGVRSPRLAATGSCTWPRSAPCIASSPRAGSRSPRARRPSVASSGSHRAGSRRGRSASCSASRSAPPGRAPALSGLPGIAVPRDLARRELGAACSTMIGVQTQEARKQGSGLFSK